jgi:hypothetical protein
MKTRPVLLAVYFSISFARIPVFAANPTLLVMDQTPLNNAIDAAYDPYNQQIIATANFPTGNPFNLYMAPYFSPNPFSPFGTVSQLDDEVKLTVAPVTSAGFSLGEVFVANFDTGYVMRLNSSGSPSNPTWWTPANASTLDDCGLFFDVGSSPPSSMHRLFVATEGGDMFKVASDGSSSQILSTSATSGPGIAPAMFQSVVLVSNNATWYGPLAGKAIACDSRNALLYIADPNKLNSYSAVSLNWLNSNDGSVTHIQGHTLLAIPPSDVPVLDLWIVFWDVASNGANTMLRRINHFGNLVPAGTFLITSEFSNTVYYKGATHVTHFWTMRYNSQIAGGIQVEPLIVVDQNTGLEVDSPVIEGATWVPH